MPCDPKERFQITSIRLDPYWFVRDVGQGRGLVSLGFLDHNWFWIISMVVKKRAAIDTVEIRRRQQATHAPDARSFFREYRGVGGEAYGPIPKIGCRQLLWLKTISAQYFGVHE
jgi:hypothetical protein